jgi:AcrR family transcriptional regulator
MPRPLTPGLDHRILDAAQTLWSEGGEEALSIRAIAERAGTHPPRIYARFEDKEALVRALRTRAVARWRATISGATSLRDGLIRYLDFATDEPFEYQLMFGPGFYKRADRSDRGRPLEVLKRALASERGGVADDYDSRARTIWALLHGTAMLQQEFPVGPARSDFRDACLNACELIASNGAQAR